MHTQWRIVLQMLLRLHLPFSTAATQVPTSYSHGTAFVDDLERLLGQYHVMFNPRLCIVSANGLADTDAKRKTSSEGGAPHPKRAAQAQVPEPEQSELEVLRDSIEKPFKQAAALLSSIRRPLPTQTGDGTYVAPEEHSDLLGALKALDAHDIAALLDTAKVTLAKDDWDDRDYLMEDIISAASKLPVGKGPSNALSGLLIGRLWDDLKHPPQTTLGKESQYRSADGSGNCLMYPHIGAADQPYARTVKPVHQQSAALPDPGVVFDSIMARPDGFIEPHPNKLSSMLFYLASIIIHDCFRTSHEDYSISKTSSYLDLSPLYGSNEAEQKLMRTFKDGKIKPDCFSEKRLLGFPPGVGALLIMFNRFHNHVVENLAAINEGGRFDKPRLGIFHHRPGKTEEQYDEDLFQTGRLVTCGLYVNVILIDYVRTILNLNRTNSDWSLDPRVDIPGGPPLGTGNQVSAEFNLVYRWHSTISAKDTEWSEKTYAKLFGDVDYASLPIEQFISVLGKFEANLPTDPQARPFDNLVRGEDGKFNDDDLVSVLTSSIEDCASSFGPQRVPTVMRAVEILGIKQARSWNLATLNEFREYFQLKPYKTFDEITSDPSVADQLKNLYDTPDNVELYPGLVCEDAKKAQMPGSGLMPPYTTSRAILSDAVALVRGDRFYTVDYHSKNLTNWGFSEVASDKTINHGCVFYKLFYTAFPNHFPYNSVYAHYPLTIPDEMHKILKGLGKADDYNFEKPTRKPAQGMVSSYDACLKVMGDKETFGVSWGPAMEFLMGPAAKNFMLAGDAAPNMESRKMMGSALYVDGWIKSVKDFYEAKTIELIHEKKYKVAGMNQVDIIRDISNLVHVHFGAELFMLPLKTAGNEHGVFTEHELYLIMAAVFTCVFFDLDPEHSFQVHQLARQATQTLGGLVEKNVESIKNNNIVHRLFEYFMEPKKSVPLPHFGKHMIQRLLASGLSVKDLVWGHIMGTAGGMVPNQGQLFGQVLEYYFTEGAQHWPDIASWAKLDGPEADEKLIRYILEGSRIYCSSAVFRDVHENATVVDNGRTISFKKGDKVMVNLYAASHDEAAFPNPDQVDLTRDMDSYVQLGWGQHQCLGLEMTRVGLMSVLRVIAKLPNIRPVAGPQGRVAKTPSPVPGYWQYLTETANGFFPFPVSMKVNWDDEVDPLKTNGDAVNGKSTNGKW